MSKCKYWREKVVFTISWSRNIVANNLELEEENVFLYSFVKERRWIPRNATLAAEPLEEGKLAFKITTSLSWYLHM